MTLDRIIKDFGIAKTKDSYVEIPNFGRDDLAQLFARYGMNRGVEVGVEKGEYSEVLCKANPDLELSCVDPWKKYGGYNEFGKNMDRNYRAAKERLDPFGCRLIRLPSMEAVQQFEDNSLDFVYIDAHHNLQNMINDLSEWSKKLKIGGIMSGHDYRLIHHKNPDGSERIPNLTHHVVEALEAFRRSYKVQPIFILGRRERREGETRDKARSWMFVKRSEYFQFQ